MLAGRARSAQTEAKENDGPWRPRRARISHQGQTNRSLECGDSSPLSIAATGRGKSPSADESALEKAGASSRTPKFASERPDKLFDRGERGNPQKGPSKAVVRNAG
jgi:hypothetical protein